MPDFNGIEDKKDIGHIFDAFHNASDVPRKTILSKKQIIALFKLELLENMKKEDSTALSALILTKNNLLDYLMSHQGKAMENYKASVIGMGATLGKIPVAQANSENLKDDN